MNTIQSYAHLAKQLARTGWYFGLRQVTERQVKRLENQPPKISITKATPNTRQLLLDVANFLREDAELVRKGTLPSITNNLDSPPLQFRRIRQMFEDLPVSHERRVDRKGKEVAEEHTSENTEKISSQDLPDYFVQNFHYQTGGYLTEESAELYDLQVETLFLGTAGAMRRQALKPIAEFIKGKDQRKFKLLDIACGTGRFLAQVRQAFPCLPATGIDLSASYIREAERYLEGWRSIMLKTANAEQLPEADNSQDIVTCIYLFHELPPKVRRKVVQEFARVLKPGGILVFIDSLQYGDNPNYDGLLEAFPQRFHEPYYRNYLIDNLNGVFEAEDLNVQETKNALLSKIVVCKKA